MKYNLYTSKVGEYHAHRSIISHRNTNKRVISNKNENLQRTIKAGHVAGWKRFFLVAGMRNFI